MKTPPRICFVTDHTFLPDRTGGREWSIDSLARWLTTKGAEVVVVACAANFRNAITVLPRRILWRSEYKISRVRDIRAEAETLLLANRTDFVIYNVHSAGEYISSLPHLRRRQFFFIRDNEDHSLASLRKFDNVNYVANSNFTASFVRQALGIQPFILTPMIDPRRYATVGAGQSVTFINPVTKKGVHIALAVAQACRDVEFLFVESWPLSRQYRQQLSQRLRNLPNVSLRSATQDMRSVYGETQILLVPSECDEAFGRVAVEAQISGIPVIATRRGGLPEAVGEGGILLDSGSAVSAWVGSIQKLIEDEGLYRDLSKQASQHARQYIAQCEATAQLFWEWLQAKGTDLHGLAE